MDDDFLASPPPPDPIDRFRAWLEAAEQSDDPEPTAMVLATVSPDGAPAARTVLLKGVDRRGFVFFTNYRSDKGHQLASQPACTLVFRWASLQRQVRVSGRVQVVETEESDAYWASRPRGSQLGAMASPQSQVVADRQVLDDRYRQLESELRGIDALARPSYWGGYRVIPEAVEFWAGRAERLHDRQRYRLDGGSWIVETLAP